MIGPLWQLAKRSARTVSQIRAFDMAAVERAAAVRRPGCTKADIGLDADGYGRAADALIGGASTPRSE
jgi:hypothetical protein